MTLQDREAVRGPKAYNTIYVEVLIMRANQKSLKPVRQNTQPITYATISELYMDRPSAERILHERRNNHRSSVNVKVPLPYLGPLEMHEDSPHYTGDQIEEAFFQRFKDDCDLINQFPDGSQGLRKFRLCRCKPQGDNASIVDYVAYDAQYWFPIEFKCVASLSYPVPTRNTLVSFRNRFQAIALYAPADKDVNPFVDCSEKIRLPGLVIRREYIPRKAPWKFPCSVFIAADPLTETTETPSAKRRKVSGRKS